MTKNNLFSISNSLDSLFNQVKSSYSSSDIYSPLDKSWTSTEFMVYPNIKWEIESFDWDNFNLSKIEMPHYPVSNANIMSDGSIVIEIATTGFDKDEIEIEVEDSILIIKGALRIVKDTIEDRKGIKNDITVRKELAHNLKIKDFEWKRKIHENYDMEKLEASNKNGLLTVIIPLKEEKKPIKRKIEIK